MPGIVTTKDGFLDNSFFVSQPAKGPHRAGLDAVFLAAALPHTTSGRVADFGAGCGVAGMALAQRCKNVEVDLIEKDTDALANAKTSLSYPENKHFKDRLHIVTADLSLGGADREAAGLRQNSYDHIISNPPYNHKAHFHHSPNQQRAASHVMQPGLLEAWIRTAAYVARPKASLTLILRVSLLEEVLIALKGRFGSISILPIHPTGLMIVRARLGGRAALEIEPSFTIQSDPDNHRPTGLAEEVLRGRCGLFDED